MRADLSRRWQRPRNTELRHGLGGPFQLLFTFFGCCLFLILADKQMNHKTKRGRREEIKGVGHYVPHL